MEIYGENKKEQGMVMIIYSSLIVNYLNKIYKKGEILTILFLNFFWKVLFFLEIAYHFEKLNCNIERGIDGEKVRVSTNYSHKPENQMN